MRRISLRRDRGNLLIMQFAIHSDRLDQMNAIGATSMSSQSAVNASLTNFAKIKMKMNTKMSKIRKFYESKKKNLTEMMSWTTLTKLFVLMKNAMRHECENETKRSNCDSKKQTTRLKEITRKLKRIAEKTINIIKENIWAKIIFKDANVAFLTLSMLAINAFSKRRFNKKIKLITWIKKNQKMKKMQKMSAAKIIALTRELNTMNTLFARKNIVKIKKFKKLMIFKIVFKKNKKILKLNNFWIKNVAITTTFRRERFEIMIHEIKVKNMFQNIKNENAKVIKKIDEIMHSKLQIKSVKWLVKNHEKKKYVLMIMWMRDAKIANRLI